MSDIAGRVGWPRHKQPGAITAPLNVVISRPRYGWILGSLVAGVKAVAVLVTVAVTLVVLVSVTAALWWVGDARIPVLFLVCGAVALAVAGFAFGHTSRVLAWRRLPEGPSRLVWPPGTGQIRTGLVWEQEDPAITNPAGPSGEKNCQ